jgi:phosphoglycolate phosphatase
VKRFIFDMDGTLSDTAKATAAALNTIAEKRGVPPIGKAALKEAMGLPGVEFWRKILPGFDEEFLRSFEAELSAEEDRIIETMGSAILFPGIAGTLEQLRKRGADLYIASTGSPAHVEATLGASGIKRLFTGIYCGRNRKIEMVREILNHDDPGRWIMIGDKCFDAEAAKNNGIYAIGAGYGYCDKTDYFLFDEIIDRPGRLLEIAESRTPRHKRPVPFERGQ